MREVQDPYLTNNTVSLKPGIARQLSRSITAARLMPRPLGRNYMLTTLIDSLSYNLAMYKLMQRNGL
jgi:hypothetical protein